MTKTGADLGRSDDDWSAKRMLDLDNFLASYFGGPGTREETLRFLIEFQRAGFVVYLGQRGNP